VRSRVLLHWWAGTIGGVIGWMLVEPIPWLTTDPGPGQPPIPVSWAQTATLGLLIGLAISACTAAAYGFGSRNRMLRFAGLGALCGAVGGAVGMMLGQFLYQTILTLSEAFRTVVGPVGFLIEVSARSLGWASIGFGLGLLQGGINASWQRSRNGAIGGLIGGFLGGFLFELLMRSFGWILGGEVLRLIGITITGSFIGLLVGLAERVFRNAWVRVLVGRNEGPEFLLEKPVNTIGRDERADIPLYGDPSIAPVHAQISAASGGYVLQAQGQGVSLNGQFVQTAPLSEGDIIGVGGRQIQFHQKGAPRAVGQKDVAQPAVAPAPAVPEGVCGFCGERFDAQGLCACSPVGAPPAAPAGAPPVAVPTGGYSLVATSGPYAGQVFPLEKPEVTIGREPGNDFCLEADRQVSRRHAKIHVSPGGLEVVDEGSSNGTMLNGSRVTRAPAHAGDELVLGGSRFQVRAA
jgi:pSer/pThr/pTyr-binding forkhead associated (FHA) protein